MKNNLLKNRNFLKSSFYNRYACELWLWLIFIEWIYKYMAEKKNI